MNSDQLKILLLLLVVVGYLFDQWLSWLNHRNRQATIPLSLSGIYDADTYRKQQDYKTDNYRLSVLTEFLSFAIIFCLLLFGGFAWLDTLVRSVTGSGIWQALLFFGILALVADLLGTPFDLYDTFVIEQKYHFNTTTIGTFILDKLKSWLLTGIIGGGLLALIVWIYQDTGDWFWLLTWAAITAFSIFAGYFYTTLLVPVFNKLSPLPAGELRDSIQGVAQRSKFELRNIYVMDGSKRSTKGNAYFSGFGKRKSIVLFDTLVNDHSVEELTAILAHEIGHYRKKHVLKGILLSIIQTGFLLFVLSYVLKSPLPANALGSSLPSFHMSVVAFGILYSPLSLLLKLGMNSYSRRNEFEADRFAASISPRGIMQQALKKLASKNLTNLTPHPWFVIFNYSHPSLLQRLAALDKADDNEGEVQE